MGGDPPAGGRVLRRGGRADRRLEPAAYPLRGRRREAVDLFLPGRRSAPLRHGAAGADAPDRRRRLRAYRAAPLLPLGAGHIGGGGHGVPRRDRLSGPLGAGRAAGARGDPRRAALAGRIVGAGGAEREGRHRRLAAPARRARRRRSQGAARPQDRRPHRRAHPRGFPRHRPARHAPRAAGRLPHPGAPARRAVRGDHPRIEGGARRGGRRRPPRRWPSTSR